MPRPLQIAAALIMGHPLGSFELLLMSENLIPFKSFIGYNSVNVTVQYPAEIVDSGSTQGLVFAKPVNGGA